METTPSLQPVGQLREGKKLRSSFRAVRHEKNMHIPTCAASEKRYLISPNLEPFPMAAEALAKAESPSSPSSGMERANARRLSTLKKASIPERSEAIASPSYDATYEKTG